MTQQLWEVTAPPPAKSYSRRDKESLVLGFVVFLAFFALIVNVLSRPSHITPPLQVHQQLPQVTPPPDPDAFEEARDGSNALVPEDENGKASVWKDTTSGARIFCLDSCIVLPVPHHHHRRP